MNETVIGYIKENPGQVSARARSRLDSSSAASRAGDGRMHPCHPVNREHRTDSGPRARRPEREREALTVGQRVDRASGNGAGGVVAHARYGGKMKDRLDIDGGVARNPYGMMAAAVGVGYMLGGGLLLAAHGARLVGLAFAWVCGWPRFRSWRTSCAADRMIVSGAGEVKDG